MYSIGKKIHSYFQTKYLSLFKINNVKNKMKSTQSHTQALHFAPWARALGHRRRWGSKAEQIFTGKFCFPFPVSVCLFCVSPQRESKQGMGRGEPAHGQHFSIKRLSGNWSQRGQDRMWPYDFWMESRCGIQPEMTPAGSLPIGVNPAAVLPFTSYLVSGRAKPALISFKITSSSNVKPICFPINC